MPQRNDELNEVSPLAQQRNEFALVSITDVTTLMTTAFILSGIIFGIKFLASQPITHVHLITALCIICSCLSMLEILKLMKYVMGYIHKRYNTGEINRCRNQMIIGFGGISMCGIITKIVFFFVDNYHILYYCFITSSVTSVIFFYHFIYEFQEKWKVNYEKKYTPLISILIAIQFIVLIITIIIIIIWFSDVVITLEQLECFKRRMLVEIHTAVFFAPSMIDMGVVLAGGIKKNPKVEMESVEVVVQPSTPGNPIIEANSPRMDCKICMEEYSESVIPRILKECGHTICEKCAGKILDKNNGQHLFCPFCQTVTIVKGPASQLSKNFAITNMIDEKMQMNGH